MNFKKILRYIIFGFCILAAIILSVETMNWQLNKNKYNKVYVYKDVNGMYYENNNEKVYLKNVYDKNGEKLDLNISEDNIAIMYCKKDIPSEAIYLHTYNSDRLVEQPVLSLYLILLAIIVAYYALPKKNNTNNPIMSYYLIYLYIFLIGFGFLGTQVYDVINYNKLKSENNVVIANIDNKYKIEGENVFNYYVNGNKYVYSEKKINENEQIEMYYNQKDPNIAYKKGKAINVLMLITGLLLVILTAPIIFSKNRMAKRYEKAINKNI